MILITGGPGMIGARTGVPTYRRSRVRRGGQGRPPGDRRRAASWRFTPKFDIDRAVADYVDRRTTNPR
ncbi:hypothetical protein MF672_007895 [Actinomadura sp. ATCC 31491]|uniref:Uncharacterized protein n=1 Tax=Actinomadura luzonensis TaxID=2805427 RepID=A0ABT0FN29_9ACTN|nr:hypothetical protein [Actinomadura luzonensis]MCK2213707.1 hypothetical protein [Actinomadura luzonensis]